MSSVIRGKSSINIKRRRRRKIIFKYQERLEKSFVSYSISSVLKLLLLCIIFSSFTIQVTKSDSCVNETSDSCLPGCPDVGIGIESSLEASKSRELDELRVALSRYYKFPSTGSAHLNSENNNNNNNKSKEASDQRKQLNELPVPRNLSVLVISWYPPVLRLTWDLHDIRESENREKELNFYQSNNSINKNSSLLEEIDLALLTSSSTQPDNPTATGNDVDNDHEVDDDDDDDDDEGVVGNQTESRKSRSEERIRRLLVRKALTCFQVTYNIVNSRFKVTEEYPPYLRSILLERLLPATEYSLQVAAVYLNRHRLVSERVQFVSPTDNESRRFKENTYRPIHHYPDIEPRNVRYGLGQVRSEELTIVAIALLFWVATICLFFNKWGKIRMLEPYQPAYREAESPAPFAAHHHPSLLNLANSAVGSAGTGGSGHALTSTQVVAVAAKLGASVEGTRNSGTGELMLGAGELSAVSGAAQCLKAAAAARHSDGALSCSPLGSAAPIQAPTATPVSTAVKPHRALVKRFESVASQDSLLNARRTDAELNYLFQSKAHVLAKATSLWSRQQQQKLRQQQYRNAQQHVELEMLRRTSQALLLTQRQRQMSTCSPVLPSSNATPVHSSIIAQQQTSSFERPVPAQIFNAQQQPRTVSAQMCHSTDAQQERSHSMEQQTETEEATGNKLRRLLFMSKSNQHQHIATSTSSSTLINLQQQQQQQQQQNQQMHSIYSSNFSNSKQVNSVSLDAGPLSAPGQSTPEQSSPTGKLRQASTESAPPTSLFGFPRMRGRSRTLGRTIAPSTEPHHILIEPPSPPNPRELLTTPAHSPSSDNSSTPSNQNQNSAVQLLAPAELQAMSGGQSQSGVNESSNGNSSSSYCDKQEEFERQRLLACQDYPVDNKQQHERPFPSGQIEGEEMEATDMACTRFFAPTCSTANVCEHDHDNHHVQCASNQQQQQGGAFLTSSSSSASLRNLSAIGGELNASGYAFELQQQQQQRRASSFTGPPNNGRPAIRLDSSRQQQQQSDRQQPAVWGGEISGGVDGRDAFARLARSRARQGDAIERLDSSRSALQLNNPNTNSTMYRQPQVSSGFTDLPDCTSRRHQSFCGGGGDGDGGCTDVGGGGYAEYAYSTTSVQPPHVPRQTSQQCLQCALIQLASGEQTRTQLCWKHLHQRPSCTSQTSQTSQNSTCALHVECAGSGTEFSGAEEDSARPRLSSVFASSSYSRAHRGSFAMLRALSQKKSKSAEDVAYLSSLVLQIWVRDRNPLLQSVSQQQLQLQHHEQQQQPSLAAQAAKRLSGSQERHQHHQQQQLSRRQRPKSSLTVAHI